MGSITNTKRAEKMPQSEKDVMELEVIDDYIENFIMYVQKQLIPRLPANSFANIKAELKLKHLSAA